MTAGDHGEGWKGRVSALSERVGWWPRWSLIVLAGLIFGQLSLNVNVQTVAINCLVYAILSLGLNIVVGWAGLLDLGYIAFFGCGAYGYAMFSSHALGAGGISGTGGIELSAVVSIPLVVLATGVIGAVIGLVSLRVSGDYLAIVTLFVGQAFMEAVNNVDASHLGGVNGLFGLNPIHAFGGSILTPNGYYYFGLIVVAVLVVAMRNLEQSRTGRAWRAIREDELAAGAMTIRVRALKVMAVGFGAAVAALAGTIFAAQQDNVLSDQLHCQHPDPDLRVPGARWRRVDLGSSARWSRRHGWSADGLQSARRRLSLLRVDPSGAGPQAAALAAPWGSARGDRGPRPGSTRDRGGDLFEWRLPVQLVVPGGLARSCVTGRSFRRTRPPTATSCT